MVEPASRLLELVVNGEHRSLAVADGRTLLEILREDLGLTGTKHGCELGECGACTVLVDDRPRLACLTLGTQVAGAQVTTIEGLGNRTHPHPVQQAFVDHGAVQCGYCTAGMIMTAAAAIEAAGTAGITPDDAREAIAGNVCRCTGYAKIVQAVVAAGGAEVGLRAAEATATGPDANGPPTADGTPDIHGPPPADVALGALSGTIGARRLADDAPGTDAQPTGADTELTSVGRRLPKVDAWDKVTGQALYADDLSFPGALHARLLRCPHPHALVLRIDTAPALALEGVVAVITGADLPAPYGVLPVSQDEHGLTPDRGRFVGDPVAAVAAVSEAAAEAALAAIEVDYEVLPAAFDPAAALAGEALYPTEPEAPGLVGATAERPADQPGDQPADRPARTDAPAANVHRAVALEFGRVDEGLAEADRTWTGLYRYAGNTHLALEEHSCTAVPEAGGVTLWSSTQTPHYVQRALATALQLPADRVRVRVPALGGGFGGKAEALPHEVAAAKLALVTGKPVKITLSREEVFYTHRGRHPVDMELHLGATKDGKITALAMDAVLDGGGYGSYGVATTYYTGALLPATYDLPTYRFRAARIHTNKPPCGPKRGHGTPQPRFALEVLLDEAADDLGINPADLRLTNLISPDMRTVNHLRITSCGLAECLEAVVSAAGFRERHGHLPPGQGVGLACSSYLSGAGLPVYWNELPHSSVRIEADRTGAVTVFCGATDIGQGSDTVLATLVAEVLGLPPERLRLVTADTGLTPVDLGSYSSRVTFMMGNAAIEAATKLRRRVDEAASAAGLSGAERTWARACRAAEAAGVALSATGSYTPPPLAGPYRGSGVGPSPAYSYSACVVAVSVDLETGVVTPTQVWLAHDLGRALNPTLAEGQVEGGVYMGLSEALHEEQAFRSGLVSGAGFLDYKTPTALDMPPIHVTLVETIDREGPFGAKEVGQGPLLPVPPAVANAVFDAVGVRMREVPITPDKVHRALQALGRGRAFVGPRALPSVAFPPPIFVEPPVV